MRIADKLVVARLALLGSLAIARAGTWVDDFSSDPVARGWKVFGNTNLFRWNATNQALNVTWDSSQTNSYFYLPLGTILARSDDFALAFDLTFSDYVTGTNPNKPYAFQAAIGFLNLTQAMQTNFCRGAGVNAAYGPKNLVEFDYFPAFSSYLPTIAQTIISTNNSWLYNHDNLIEMPPGELFRVRMTYSAATATLTTTVTNHGAPYGYLQLINVPTNFDFRISALAISSYSEWRADGSILAHGTVDNLTLTTPPLPVLNCSGIFTNHIWRHQFLSQSNWLYTLERSSDLMTWTNITAPLAGTAGTLTLLDTNAPAAGNFYRIRAIRP